MSLCPKNFQTMPAEDEDVSFARRLTAHCLDFFAKSVPSRGKPRAGSEWTVFAAIVVKTQGGGDGGPLRVLSAGTGSKCLGASELSAEGDLVGDGHAEVVARRGLVRFLLREMSAGGGCLLERGPGSRLEWRRREGTSLHLFATHPPCGDAAISFKEEAEPESKRSRPDQNRTGAKCADGEAGDALGAGGLDYHTSLGVLRRKPGRGDPTASLSCSDKILRWGCLGLQGSLLASVLQEPLRLSSVTVCSPSASEDSLLRALARRAEGLSPSGPGIHTVRDVEFGFHKKDGLSPTPCSIVYTASPDFTPTSGHFEVCVDGRRQGCVRRHFGTSRAMLKCCRRQVAEEFLSYLRSVGRESLPDRLAKVADKEQVTYGELKALSREHTERKKAFRSKLVNWPLRNRERFDSFRVGRRTGEEKKAPPPLRVCLFKSDESDGVGRCQYASALEEVGCEVSLVRTLEFSFDLGPLAAVLRQPGRFSGLALTSRRGVAAVREVLLKEQREDLLEEWRKKTAFAVGKATAKACAESLGLEAKGGEEAGCAGKLADYVLAQKRTNFDLSRPLLFPAGDLARDELVSGLRGGGVEVEKVVCYRTQPARDLVGQVRAILAAARGGGGGAGDRLAFVFFSPSCVEYSRPLWESESDSLVLGAMGPSTARALRESGLPVGFVCEKPEPRHLAAEARRTRFGWRKSEGDE